MKSRPFFLTLFALSLILFSCSNEKSNWSKAKLENTLQSYKSFSFKYPDGVFSDSARLCIKLIEYNNAQTANTVDSLKAFVAKYQHDSLALRAQAIIDNYWIVTDLSYTIEKSISITGAFSETTLTAKEGHIICVHGNFSVAENSNDSVLLSDITLAGRSSDSSSSSNWKFQPLAVGTFNNGECTYDDFQSILRGTVEVRLPSQLGFIFSKPTEGATGILALIGKNVPFCLAFPASSIPNSGLTLTLENRSFPIVLNINK
jgi:hypothetical protein